jgi:chemotaxis protein CheZ
MTNAAPDAIDPIRLAVRAELVPLLDDLRRFMDRRVAELSNEVHGATQLLGYSEDNLSSQLTRLHEQVANMIAAPGEATRNSGLELEAVVHTTEAAANQIMEAAEAISGFIRTAIPDRAAVAQISARVDDIFAACAFQDLTGQRVRRAIEHLQHLESSLSGMITPPGEVARPIFQPQAPTVVSNGADLPQGDIDALFD